VQEDLAARLGRDVDLVDLVDLRTASTVLAAQVLSHGQIVFDQDARARAEFEMVALAEYADLNDRRKGILDDIQQRGHVYG